MYDWQKKELLDAFQEILELSDDYDVPQNITDLLDEANQKLEDLGVESEEDDE